jgi:membrane-bound lytic murein transglycosylase F
MIFTETYYSQFKMALMILAATITIIIGYYSKNPIYKNEIPGDNTNGISEIQKIKKAGKLTAISENSSTSYYIYKGEPMGFEYEMLSSFAKYLGVELEIIPVKNMDSIFDQIYKMDANIIAANLTITREHSENVLFTDPLLLTHQV